MTMKESGIHPQAFGGSLQIGIPRHNHKLEAYATKSQAGSLCYSASVADKNHCVSNSNIVYEKSSIPPLSKERKSNPKIGLLDGVHGT